MRIVTALLLAACACAGVRASTTESAGDDAKWVTAKGSTSCKIWNPEPEPRETITWTGPCNGGKAHGRGILVWRFLYFGGWREDRYEGEVREGRPHGFGVFRSRRGTRYEGRFVDGAMSGYGVIEWANGSRYEGNFELGKRQGTGTFSWPDGERYEGQWLGGRRHGFGRCTLAGESDPAPCCYRFNRPVGCD